VISLGHVNRAAREPRTAVILPPTLEARLETAYASCSASLRDRCEVLAVA
jgi:hypothetical protein